MRAQGIQPQIDLLLHRAKIAILLGTTIFPAFAALDWVVARGFFFDFLAIRLAVSLTGLFLFLLLKSFGANLARHLNLLTLAFTLSIQVAICFMCLKLGGFTSSYYTGLIVVMLGVSILMPWSPLYMGLFNLGTLGGYLSLYAGWGWNAPSWVLANNFFFLFCAVFLTMIGSFLQFRNYARLNQEQQARAQLVSMVSHDLRGPLGIVRDCFRMLGDMNDPAERLKVADLGVRNTGRALALLNELLDLHRLEVQKMPLEKRSVKLGHLVEEVVELVSPQASEKGIQVSFEENSNRAPLSLDPDKVRRVVENLLRNAIQHSPLGGKVQVSLEERDSSVVCHVRDVGEGIEPKRIPHLFQEFSAGREPGRFGLGLFISRRFVEMHGGSIWVDSTPGKGSTFSFSLPRKIKG